MTTRNTQRLLSLSIAIILFAIPILTPFAELSGTHNHTCSPARCALCMVSNALRDLSGIFAAILFTLIASLLTLLRFSVRSIRHFSKPTTPVELKTKILS